MAQLNIVLLTLGALQGALIGGYFIRKQKFGLANTYFLLILIVAGLQLTFKVLSKVWLMEHYRLPYFMHYHLPYLVGPLLYLYVRARAGQKSPVKSFLHFLPFLILAILVVVQNANPWRYRILSVHAYTHATLQILSLCLYGYFSWRLVLRGRIAGLKSFLIGLVSSEVVVSITLALMYIHYRTFPDVRLLFVALTLFIYWVSYKMMESPSVFAGERLVDTIPLQIHSTTKYTHSGLKSEEAKRIASLLTQAMHQQKRFLESDLTIDLLAQQLGVSRHHISQVLNEQFHQTYTDFISDFRLSEAKSRLQDSKYHHYAISAIAMDCGFSSVSNFNDLFKKKFAQTPSQCRSEGRGKMTA